MASLGPESLRKKYKISDLQAIEEHIDLGGISI